MSTGRTMLVLLGAKGGVGTSTIAANLALRASEIHRNGAVLVDWAAGRDGGTETIISAPARQSHLVLLRKFDLWSSHTQEDPEAGVKQRLEALLREGEGPVLVDGGTEELPVCLLLRAQRILLVGTPDLQSVRGLQNLVRALTARLGTLARVALVLNRVPQAGGVSAADVQAAVGCPTLVAIPEDHTVVRDALTLGGGLHQADPSSGAAKAVHRLADKVLRGRGAAPDSGSDENALPSKMPEHHAFRRDLHARIVARLNDVVKGEEALSRDRVQQVVSATVEETTEAHLLTREDRYRLVRDIVNEVVGLGPLESYLEDETVTEIMVNGHRQLYVERAGHIDRVEGGFVSDEQVLRVIERIIGPQGRRIDESSPMVDARLPDGSRVNAIIPPLSVDGPLLTIRKFASKPLLLDDLVRRGTLTREMGDFLATSVRERKNIIIAGGTGSGKTTLLNALSGCIPDDERIITIEDAAELRLQQEHVARLEARPPNIEGQGAVAIRDLVRNALRMRPDRIIIGEVRGGEALDMLQAMNTGHAGAMSTVHANSARDALSRLETMVLMAGMDLPVRAIRDQMVAALDLIVHQERQHDGARKVTSITEVVGIEDGVILLRDCFQPGEKIPVQTSKSRERRANAGITHNGQGVA